MSFRNVIDVARWRLCVGCGACATVCEGGHIALRDIPELGIRPTAFDVGCIGCGRCIAACPGLGYVGLRGNAATLEALQSGWGPVLEVWEGYAAAPAIRYGGSSGGAATAIALYCMESNLAGGVLHVDRDEEEPWRNGTVISRTRQDLITRTGSRYSPASPCSGLGEVASASLPSVFLGKPCDVQGLRKVEALSPALREKVRVALGIFCAGTPATAGVLALLDRLGVLREEVQEVRFRGNGWPGAFVVRLKDGRALSRELSYRESWGFLQAYRPFRCYLCPDGTSEFADISCGDPWYRGDLGNDPGRSLVLVRTARGREVLRGAMEAGVIHLESVPPDVVERSQVNLLMKRRAIWGRLAAMKAFGLPVPRYEGVPLLENWLDLPLEEKARSTLGTVRRILQRKYTRPLRDIFDRSCMRGGKA